MRKDVTCVIDMHSHILPKIDDGANSVETSIAMLRKSKKQGVETVVATSHCYVKNESDIDKFIKKGREFLCLLRCLFSSKCLHK